MLRCTDSRKIIDENTFFALLYGRYRCNAEKVVTDDQ